MVQKTRHSGMWWVPDRPKDQISGILRFYQRETGLEIVLNLNGSFEETLDSRITVKHDIILGVTSDGENITLSGCYQISAEHSIPGYTVSSFLVSMVFKGFHFRKPEDIEFKSISISYSYLQQWIGKKLFRSTRVQEKNKLTEFHVIFTYPETIHMRAADFDIKLTHSFSYSGGNFRPPKLETKPFVTVESRNELRFEKWESFIYHIRNFLCLAVITTGELVYPQTILGRTSKNVTLTNGRTVLPPIEIFIRHLRSPPEEDLYRPFMLFTFNDISHQPDIYFQNWLGKSEILQPVYDLFFSTLYTHTMYVTNQFMNLVQALESYHRRTMRNYVDSEEEYSRKVQEILCKTPKEHRKWLTGRLQYGNEPPLRERLQEIVNSLKIGEFVGENEKSVRSFIQKVVVTRNYLTHYDKKLEKKVVEPENLFPITIKLQLILLACLLKEIGFELDKVAELVRKFFERYYELWHPTQL